MGEKLAFLAFSRINLNSIPREKLSDVSIKATNFQNISLS